MRFPMLSGLGIDLIAERDRIGNEINRLRQLQSSVEDPGPFYIPGRFQERWDGGAQISAASVQEAAAQGYPWPVTIANPDYIADEERRALVQADLQQQIDALTAELNQLISQGFYGGADPSKTVVRVTTQQTPTGPVQVVTTGPASMSPTAATTLLIPEDDGDGGGGGPYIPPDDTPPPSGGGGDGNGGPVVPEILPTPSKGIGFGVLAAIGIVALLAYRRSR